MTENKFTHFYHPQNSNLKENFNQFLSLFQDLLSSGFVKKKKSEEGVENFLVRNRRIKWLIGKNRRWKFIGIEENDEMERENWPGFPLPLKFSRDPLTAQVFNWIKQENQAKNWENSGPEVIINFTSFEINFENF